MATDCLNCALIGIISCIITDTMNIINTEIINTETDKFWHDGRNEKITPYDLLIVCDKYNDNSAEHIQLSKIIDACKIAPDKFTIVQIDENKPLAWHKLKRTYTPQTVVLFGPHPGSLGISALLALHQPNHFDGCILIPALSLSALEQNAQAKKDLWLNALKPFVADKQ